MRLSDLPTSDYDEDLDGPMTATTFNTQPGLQVKDDREPKSNPLTGKKMRQRSSSFAAVVSDLEVGESASRVHMLNEDMTLAQMRDDMKEMKAMISNNARPSVTMAKQRTGGEYRIETGETITTSGRVFLLVIVTRTA